MYPRLTSDLQHSQKVLGIAEPSSSTTYLLAYSHEPLQLDYAMLGISLWALCMLGRHSTSQLNYTPRPSVFSLYQ